MLPIQKKITPYNKTVINNKKNEFIVIHYVGSQSSAANNAKYFYNNKLNASASYFVDETSIWQCVEDKDKAWHCGDKIQDKNYHPYYQICTNSNSIGIEMCCKKDNNGNWYIEEETIKNTIDLTKMLMTKYNIGLDHVIMHRMVSGKICPEPFVRRPELWEDFKNRLVQEEEEIVTQEQFNEMMNVWIADSANAAPGDWSVGAREWATAGGLVKGDEQGRQMWKKNMTREEFVSVLSRLFNIDDSGVSSWSADARNWAQDKGLVSGSGNDYGWMDYITKEQLITILYRLMENKK